MTEKHASPPSSIPKDARILIAGGGIGGLALALSLQQWGFRPLVFERAPELKEIGAGLLLSPNGVHALERLNLREKATARGRVISQWRILDRGVHLNKRIKLSQDFHQCIYQ